jgi:Nif-specific regulatory protein
LNTQNIITGISLLYDISQSIIAGQDIHSVFSLALKMLSEYMKLDKGMLTIYNRKSGEIFIEVAFGLTPDEIERGVYKPGEGIIGSVIDTGNSIVIPRISEEPKFLDKTGSRKKQNKKEIAFICVPIKYRNEVIGALCGDRLGSHNTTLDEDVKLFSIISTMISQAVRLHQVEHEELELLENENKRLQNELKEKFKPANIVGKSKVMKQVYELIEKISQTSSTVLILGESGVGKELVAHAIHYNSSRQNMPFVKFSCAALPESTIESELFGHEKGSFTGAFNKHIGRFEMAEGGTIFLDEIGELTPAVQTKLLRVLQEKEFERVGGTKTIKADIRIITATNRDLEEQIKEGKFREDLYYRLNVFPIIVPPLRERKTDILLLTDHFVEQYSRATGKEIKRVSTSSINMLMSYHWPGNVRELENIIERAVILSEDKVIHGYHLPPTLQTAHFSHTKHKYNLESRLNTVEYDLIIESLKNHKGNMVKAAKELGLTPRIMSLRVKKYNLNPQIYKKPD